MTGEDSPVTEDLLPEELARLRAETPLVASGRVHFNHAGASPQPQPVLDAVLAHLELENTLGGYEAADEAAAALEAARADIARCIGSGSGEVAFTESATVSYAQAISAFDWERGDSILLSRVDYASNQIMAISLQRRRGVRVLRAEDLPEGGVDPGSVEELVREHRPKLVSITHMPTSSGLVQDVEAVGRVCREHEVPYLVDACQTVGQMPVDVEAIGCDFLAATGRKYLRGPRGTGLLYVSRRVLEAGRHPLTLDLRGAEWTEENDYDLKSDARRFELWESSIAGRLGLGAAARYALDVGLDRIHRQSAAWARLIRQRARETPGLEPADRGGELGAIVSLAVDDAEPADLVGRLRERGVNTSATLRGSALLDVAERTGGPTSTLRVSAHYLTDADDIERLFAALEEVL